ncbi:MAG: sodium:proton exchanger, partial [Actinomycetota bacterium]
MTRLRDELHDVHPARQGLGIVLAVGATVPGIAIRITDPHLSEPILALAYGLAIVGAAFML